MIDPNQPDPIKSVLIGSRIRRVFWTPLLVTTKKRRAEGEETTRDASRIENITLSLSLHGQGNPRTERENAVRRARFTRGAYGRGIIARRRHLFSLPRRDRRILEPFSGLTAFSLHDFTSLFLSR